MAAASHRELSQGQSSGSPGLLQAGVICFTSGTPQQSARAATGEPRVAGREGRFGGKGW